MGFTLRDVKMKFNGGLITRNAAAREELSNIRFGCDTLENFFPLVTGAITARGGFLHAKTLSGGLSGISDFTSSTPVGKLRVFAFETEDIDVADGFSNVYLLVILWNFTTSKPNVLVLNPSGSIHSTLTADSDMDDLPWTQESIPNIRTDQRGDVVYFVDSSSPVTRLERTGSPGSFTFTFRKMLFSDDPFDPLTEGRVNYEYRDLSTPTVFSEPIGNDLIRDVRQMSTFLSSNFRLAESGIHNDFVESLPEGKIPPTKYFVAFGNVANHGQTNYTYNSREYSYGIKWTGQFRVINEGMYVFAMNAVHFGDMFVNAQRDGEQVASKYGHPTDGNPLNELEFNNGQNNVTRGKLLSTGTHDMTARYVHNKGQKNIWGMACAWRMDADPTDPDGIDRDNISSNESSALVLENRSWFGRMPYQVKISVIGVNPDITIKWEFRRIVDVQTNQFGDWQTGEASVLASLIISYDLIADLVVVDESSGNSPTFERTLTNMTLAKVTLNFVGVPNVGDFWTFNVGFERIPLSIFENPFGVSQITYPYTVKIHDSRLIFGGNDNAPFRIDASQVGLFQNFKIGPNADEAIRTNAIGARFDKIRWMQSLEKLIVGTAGALHVFPLKNESFSPENSRGKIIDHQSNAFVEPAISGSLLFAVTSSFAMVYSLQFSELEGFKISFVSRVIEDSFSTDKIKELSVGTGTLFSYAREDHNILLVLSESGRLKSFDFAVSDEFQAWAGHRIGGDSDTSTLNAKILSIQSIPTNDGDRFYALIFRDTLGLTVEYISPDIFCDHAVEVWSDASPRAQFQNGFMNLVNVSEFAFTNAPSGFWTAWYVRDGHVHWLLDNPQGFSFTVVADGGVPVPAILLSEEKFDYQPQAGDKVYAGLYFEPVMTPLSHDVSTQSGSTQGMYRGWDDPFIRVTNTLGRITVERKANPSRQFALCSGDIVLTDYLNNDIKNPLKIRFSILGSDDTGQLTFRRKTPTPFTMLMLGGNIEYDT